MDWFDVSHLDADRLLAEWRWLCPQSMKLVARSAFGDLFLRNDEGKVFWLDIDIGKLAEIGDSEAHLREFAKMNEKKQEWFAEAEELALADSGLKPTSDQCIGFSIPLTFAESGSRNKPYVIDIYEHVAFLGDLNRQLSVLPDGARVKMRFERNPLG